MSRKIGDCPYFIALRLKRVLAIFVQDGKLPNMNEREFIMYGKMIVLATLFIAAGSYSQPAREQADGNFAAGLGVGVGNSVYKGDDTRVIAVPLIRYNYGDFYISGKSLGYNIIADEAFEFGVIGQWRTDGYDDDDSHYLKGMEDRNMSFDGGLSTSYKDGWGKTTLSYVTDLLSVHDGQELALSYGKRFSSGNFSVTPSVGTAYKTSNLTDYYYGVMNKEALPNRAAYKCGESVDPFVNINIRYDFNPNWSALGMLGCEFLGSEITDSPIVDDNYQAMLMAGVMYSF